MRQRLFREDLSRNNEEGRRSILMSLPSTEVATTIYDVASFLGDPSPAVCEAAVEALVRCANRTAAGAAATSLSAEESAERGYALEALIRLDSLAVPTLLSLVGSPDTDLRRYAVEALGKIGGPLAISALDKALLDIDANVAAAAAEGFGMLGTPEAVPLLARALERGPDWVRITCLSSLGAIGGSKALRLICGLSRDMSALVLGAAAAAAGRAGRADPSDAATFLVSLLTKGEPGLWRAALVSLGRILEEYVPEELVRDNWEVIAAAALVGLESWSPEVRSAAVTCLGAAGPLDGDLGGRRAHELLETDRDPAVRLAALRSLARMKRLEPAELVALVCDAGADIGLRMQALSLMDREGLVLNGASRATLAQSAKDEWQPVLRVAVLRFLLKTRDLAAALLGASILAEEDVTCDVDALAELASCPVRDLTPILVHALAARPSQKRRRVLAAVLRPERAEELISDDSALWLFGRTMADQDWWVRDLSVRVLRTSTHEWAIQLIRQAIHDPDDRVRRRVAEASLGIGSPAEDAAPCGARQVEDWRGNSWGSD